MHQLHHQVMLVTGGVHVLHGHDVRMVEPPADVGFPFEASPLSRAMRTAELAGLTGVQPDPDLVEWDYGGYEA